MCRFQTLSNDYK